MWCKFFILFILFNPLFASPPGSRDGASDKSRQKSWDSRDDKKTQPSATSSLLSKHNYGSEPQSMPLDLSIKNRQIIQYASPSTSGEKNKLFDCPQCGKSYTTSTHLKTHVDFNHMGKKVLCRYSDCRRSFGSYVERRHHEHSIHEGITFDCNKCGRKFTRKQNLENHDRAEHQENSEFYKCDKCPYQTKHKGTLAGHKSTNH